MKRTFVSFDVFDTCLIRRCGRPEKIWDLMALRLFSNEDNRGRMSFVGNRSCIEEKLKRLGNLHPTLDDIYTGLNAGQWGFAKDFLMQLEMEIEEQELFPNPQILDLVQKYRSEGFKIAFISDMYLPMSFIKRRLIKHGFGEEKDLFFVSAECKAEKYDGSLFYHVFKETCTKAKQWIHYGDNKRSDYYVPKSKGVKSYWVSNTDFTDEEKRWLDDARFYPHKHEIELWAGLCRLTRIQNERSDRATMAVDFIASNYVPYVSWIFETAQKKGINKLFFLGRDGHIFYEIAKQINEKYPEICISYLKISRKVIYSSMFVDGSQLEFDATIGNACDRTVSELLGQIGFGYEDLSDLTKSKYPASFKLFDRYSRAFIETILKNDRSVIVDKSKENRDLLIEYLLQEGTLSADKTAFVDLGWYGSCHCNLNYILEKQGFKGIDTFFWGVYDKLMYGTSQNDIFIIQRQFGLNSHEHAAMNELMEHYASMNADGSTVAYKKEGKRIVPVEKESSENSADWVRDNERLTCAVSKNIGSENLPFDVFLCCGLKQLENIYENPSKKQIKFFSKLFFENFGEKKRLIGKYNMKDLVAMMIWNVPVQSLWRQASHKKTFGIFSGVASKVFKYTSNTSLAMKFRLWWEGRK